MTKKPANAQRSAPKAEKPVALTLKTDSQTYMRLSMLRARDRKTAQEILTEALRAYLDRAGV
jgi:predicted transcriptional regulator